MTQGICILLHQGSTCGNAWVTGGWHSPPPQVGTPNPPHGEEIRSALLSLVPPVPGHSLLTLTWKCLHTQLALRRERGQRWPLPKPLTENKEASGSTLPLAVLHLFSKSTGTTSKKEKRKLKRVKTGEKYGTVYSSTHDQGQRPWAKVVAELTDV